MSKKPTVVKTYKPSISLKKSKKNEDELSEPEIEETEKTDDDDNNDIEDNEEDEEDEEDNENIDDEIIYDEDGKICNLQKVFEDDNEFELIEYIHLLSTDRSFAKNLAINGKKAAISRHNIDSILSNLLLIYSNCISNHNE